VSGFAGYLNKTHTPRDERAHVVRYRVVRFDGVVMGGSSSRAAAERMANVIRTGQRADYAVVMVRGGEA
jgi:xanthine/CO dehydrogenase XdhC/CoxF family maturation factor